MAPRSWATLPLVLKASRIWVMRHAFVFLGMLLEMLPRFDERSVIVVKARGGILGLNRINETLAQILFDLREEHQQHHRIPIHIRGIDVGVVETFQEPGALISLLVLDPDDGVGEREMEFVQDQPGQAQGAGPVAFVGGAGLDRIEDPASGSPRSGPTTADSCPERAWPCPPPATPASLKLLTYLRANFVPSM